MVNQKKMDTSLALKRLALIVKNARSALGYNQRQFAKLFGSSHPSISNLENANYINLPDHSTLVRLSQILKIPYWELIKSLEEGAEITKVENISVEEIIIAIKGLDSIDDCLDVMTALCEQVDTLRGDNR